MLKLNGVNEEDIIPELRMLYTALKDKTITDVDNVLIVSYAPHSIRKECGILKFFDSRFASDQDKPVVMIRYMPSYVRNKDYEYVIWSKRIKNEKYAYYNDDHHTRASVDPKKALKIALEHLKPFSWFEIGKATQEKAKRAHEGWVSEKSQSAYIFNMNHTTVYEELKNLLQQNVRFVTPDFRQAVEKMGEYAEWESRKLKVSKSAMRCLVEDNGKFYLTDNAKTPAKEFDSFEALPEHYQTKVSLMRIVGDDEFLPEIGYKADGRTFWLYD
jgi:hypothetical protein